jgi:pSer/pThr/pTyr-binding forkhead associated (FHA) protein
MAEENVAALTTEEVMWTLETDDSTDDRVTFRIPAGSIKTIGRSTGAQFIVEAALVSRLQCQLSATADSLQVKDLNSTNGTFVNGKRVQTARLEDGDRLGVGRVELIVSKI